MEADLYREAGLDHAAAFAKISKQIKPPSYPPSFEVFEHELMSERAAGARMTACELADRMIERAAKRPR